MVVTLDTDLREMKKRCRWVGGRKRFEGVKGVVQSEMEAKDDESSSE